MFPYWYRGDGWPVLIAPDVRPFRRLWASTMAPALVFKLCLALVGLAVFPVGSLCESRVALPVQVMVCEKSSPSILVAMLGDIGTVMGESM